MKGTRQSSGMHMEQLRELLLSYPGVTEEEPFGPEFVVYKVMGKMFALVDYDSVPPTINLKCDPGRALDLRDVHEALRPGYHLIARSGMTPAHHSYFLSVFCRSISNCWLTWINPRRGLSRSAMIVMTIASSTGRTTIDNV